MLSALKEAKIVTSMRLTLDNQQTDSRIRKDQLFLTEAWAYDSGSGAATASVKEVFSRENIAKYRKAIAQQVALGQKALFQQERLQHNESLTPYLENGVGISKQYGRGFPRAPIFPSL